MKPDIPAIEARWNQAAERHIDRELSWRDIPALLAYIAELEALIEEESYTPEPEKGPWS